MIAFSIPPFKTMTTDQVSVGDIQGDAHNTIETNQSVNVGGSVLAGLTIRSGGDVQVGGDIETGVRIEAQGDVIVRGGMVGAATTIVSQGDVALGGVRDGDIMARGNVTVNGLLSRARVRSGKQLNLGNMVGGEVYAVDGIKIGGLVGASDDVFSTVGIVPDPEAGAKLSRVQEGIVFCERDIGRILSTLGLQTVNKAQLQVVFQRTPPHKRKFVIGLLKQLNQLVQAREDLHQKQKSYQEAQKEKLYCAQIKFAGEVCAGTRIYFGEVNLTLDRDLNASVFQLIDNQIQTVS